MVDQKCSGLVTQTNCDPRKDKSNDSYYILNKAIWKHPDEEEYVYKNIKMSQGGSKGMVNTSINNGNGVGGHGTAQLTKLN